MTQIRTPLLGGLNWRRISKGDGNALYLNWYAGSLGVYLWHSSLKYIHWRSVHFTICKLYPSWKKNKDLVFEILNSSLGKDLSNLGFSVCINIGGNVTFLKLSIPQSRVHYCLPLPRQADTCLSPSGKTLHFVSVLTLVPFTTSFVLVWIEEIPSIRWNSISCLFLLASPSSVFSLLTLIHSLSSSLAP